MQQFDTASIDALFDSWLPGALYPSEMLWLLKNIEQARPDIIIECGRQDAVSTKVLGRYFDASGVRIFSIDFDHDRARLERTRRALGDLPVTCCSGDIHIQVPRLLREHSGRKIAVVQDGAKGWESMATLLAATYCPGVSLVAQHNLHVGHVSRAVFHVLAMLTKGPCFLEFSDDEPACDQARAARERERADSRFNTENRPNDHTSLGVIQLTDASRDVLHGAIDVLETVFRPWSPKLVHDRWLADDLSYVPRLRRRTRFSLARFKRR